MASRSYEGATGGQCLGLLAAARLAHGTHALYTAYFGEQGAELPLVFCARCGAHGTTRAAKLALPCPAPPGGHVPKDAPYRKQASLAAKRMHPSKPKKALTLVTPLEAGRQRHVQAVQVQGQAERNAGTDKRRAEAAPEHVRNNSKRACGNQLGQPGEEAAQCHSDGGVLGELLSFEAAAACHAAANTPAEPGPYPPRPPSMEEEVDVFGFGLEPV